MPRTDLDVRRPTRFGKQKTDGVWVGFVWDENLGSAEDRNFQTKKILYYFLLVVVVIWLYKFRSFWNTGGIYAIWFLWFDFSDTEVFNMEFWSWVEATVFLACQNGSATKQLCFSEIDSVHCFWTRRDIVKQCKSWFWRNTFWILNILGSLGLRDAVESENHDVWAKLCWCAFHFNLLVGNGKWWNSAFS